MEAALNDFQPLLASGPGYTVDKPMLGGNPPRPISCHIALQRLRFPKPCKGRAFGISDKIVYFLDHASIGSLPELIVVP